MERKKLIPWQEILKFTRRFGEDQVHFGSGYLELKLTPKRGHLNKGSIKRILRVAEDYRMSQQVMNEHAGDIECSLKLDYIGILGYTSLIARGIKNYSDLEIIEKIYRGVKEQRKRKK